MYGYLVTITPLRLTVRILAIKICRLFTRPAEVVSWLASEAASRLAIWSCRRSFGECKPSRAVIYKKRLVFVATLVMAIGSIAGAALSLLAIVLSTNPWQLLPLAGLMGILVGYQMVKSDDWDMVRLGANIWSLGTLATICSAVWAFSAGTISAQPLIVLAVSAIFWRLVLAICLFDRQAYENKQEDKYFTRLAIAAGRHSSEGLAIARLSQQTRLAIQLRELLG